ncbi:MAG: hypothetical protein CL774_00720 [Chloroflexi bacterium]|nr:hypothetical protein [Chloroflexota bacterium]
MDKNSNYIETDKNLLEEALKKFILSRELPMYKIMSYHMGWLDRNGDLEQSKLPNRSIGNLLLRFSRCIDEDKTPPISLAVSSELLSNFLQIHEDVKYANTSRNNRESIWWVWGPAQAINTGDGVHAMARVAIFEQENFDKNNLSKDKILHALKILDECILSVCEGDYLENSFQERANVTVDEILKSVEKQSNLYGCTIALAGIGNITDKKNINTLKYAGIEIGKCLILSNDLKFFLDNKNNQINDTDLGKLQSKKKSIITSHAIENGTPSIRRKMGEIFMKRVLEDSDLKEIKNIVEETKSVEFAETYISNQKNQLINTIKNSFFQTNQKKLISDIIENIN